MVFLIPFCQAREITVIRNAVLICLIIFPPFYFSNPANAQVAPSGYSLVGTIKSGDFSGAVIIIAKEQSFFRLNEKLPDGSLVVKVRDDSISLKGPDGTLYDMYISHEKTVGSVAPPPAYTTSPQPAAAVTNVGPDRPVARSRRRHVHSQSEYE